MDLNNYLFIALQTKINYWTFYKLNNDKEYIICVRAFDKLGLVGKEICGSYKTHKKDYIPDAIRYAEINHDNDEFDFEKKKLNSTVKWTPGKGNS